MAKLSGGRYLAKLRRSDPEAAALFDKLIAAQNHSASQSGIDPVGQASAPPSPNSVSVTVTGEQAHVRIADNNPTNRPRNYWSEVYGDSARTQLLHVQDHGASRDATIVLPTYDGPMKDYYISSYSQTLGSPPSPKVDYPTYVTMNGETNGALPQSAGSGTANTYGTQPAQGYGQFSTRKATGVKRTV